MKSKVANAICSPCITLDDRILTDKVIGSHYNQVELLINNALLHDLGWFGYMFKLCNDYFASDQVLTSSLTSLSNP